MTTQQETRFRCDRCHDEVNVALNDQPALERGKPPEGWATLLIGSNTVPPSHLCPSCNSAFGQFMAAEPVP